MKPPPRRRCEAGAPRAARLTGREVGEPRGTAPGTRIAATWRLLPRAALRAPREGAERVFAALAAEEDFASLCQKNIYMYLGGEKKNKRKKNAKGGGNIPILVYLPHLLTPPVAIGCAEGRYTPPKPPPAGRSARIEARIVGAGGEPAGRGRGSAGLPAPSAKVCQMDSSPRNFSPRGRRCGRGERDPPPRPVDPRRVASSAKGKTRAEP